MNRNQQPTPPWSAAAAALRAGQPALAESLLRQVLASAPPQPEALRLLGIALHQQGRHGDARAVLNEAWQRAPASALVAMNLGSVLRALGENEACLAALQRACELAPTLAAGWFNLGKSLKSLGRVADAVEPLQRAISLQANHPVALTILGDAQKILGNVPAAESAYRAALAHRPEAGAAWWGLANIKTLRLCTDDIERMQAVLAGRPLKVEVRAQIYFALARAWEQAGDADRAFAALTEANRLQRQLHPWDRQAFSRLTDAVIASFPVTDAVVDTDFGQEHFGQELILVVSLPRSGSTLVEQVLAAHPAVAGASELPDLPIVLEQESRRTGKPFPQWVAAASAEDWRRLGQNYLARTRRWRGDRARFTDKLPNNFLYVGAALAMFPGARVVACVRSGMDTCLSCYQQYFARGQDYSYDLDDLAAHYTDYLRLLGHWSAHYPERFFVQRYEQLVADPEPQIRRLLDACALPFEVACLSPHQAQREVRTASAAQVREPIDRRGIDRWRFYGGRLQGLEQALAQGAAAADAVEAT